MGSLTSRPIIAALGAFILTALTIILTLGPSPMFTRMLQFENRFSLSHPEERDVARTPTLGWNSWYALGKAKGWPNTTGATINETADWLVSTGLAAAGYRTLVVDDSWEATTRTGPGGGLEANPKKFPEGMGAVAEHVRKAGLTLGLYTTPGNYTCSGQDGGGERGSYGHVKADIDLWVGDWGAGYIKNCVCNTTKALRAHAYKDMRAAINQQSTSVVYECNNAQDDPWKGAEASQRVCNIWTVTGDVPDSFTGWLSEVDKAVENNVNRFAGPSGNNGGGWSSLDYLQVGGQQTLDEYKAQMSMWAVFPSPIFIGTDVRHISEDNLSVYLAPEVLAVHQDPSGIPGTRLVHGKETGVEIWARPLTGPGDTTGDEDSSEFNHNSGRGARSLLSGRGRKSNKRQRAGGESLRAALLLLNRGAETRHFMVNFTQVGAEVAGLESWIGQGNGSVKIDLRDAWRREEVGQYEGSFGVEVAPHSCRLLVGSLV